MKTIIKETIEYLDYIFEEEEDNQFMDAFSKLDALDPEHVMDMDEDDEMGIDDNADADEGEGIHPDDVDLLGDMDVGIEEKDIEEAMNKKKPKSPKEILAGRYKAKSRLYILSEGGKNESITPLMIAKFNERFEWDGNLGKFGKWRVRKDKMEYKKKNPTQKAIKAIKKKKKVLKKIKKKGSVQAKAARSAGKTALKLVGKNVDAQGNIVKNV